jgi:hypothetical protein
LADLGHVLHCNHIGGSHYPGDEVGLRLQLYVARRKRRIRVDQTTVLPANNRSRSPKDAAALDHMEGPC